MSTNEAVERLRRWILRYFPDAATDPYGTDTLDAALAHERSAGAAPIEVARDVKHAFIYLNAGMDKIRDGDSPEGDLLEAHARLDSLLTRLASEGTGDRRGLPAACVAR